MPTNDELLAFLQGQENTARKRQKPDPGPAPTVDASPSDRVLEVESTQVEALTGEGNFERVDIFDSGADIAALFYEDILSGRKKLHPWQVRINEDIARHEGTINNVCRKCVVAANGSGKDAYIIACSVVYMALRYIKSNIVITSASGQQLTTQTETYIRLLCDAVNKKMGEPWFKINQRNIKCRKTGSVIRMFATDEPGKAEGFHPFPDGDGKCFIILNECKSIAEEIIQATKRCTPTHLLYISSAGEPKGSFYWAYNNWPSEDVYRITSYDCPHKDPKIIEEDALEFGEHSAWFRSKHLSLFTSLDAQVVVTLEAVNKCVATCKQWRFQHWPKRVGLDLAAGGDESVICITQGNKRIYQYPFREKDTVRSAEIISEKLRQQGIAKDSDYIWADNGGVGQGIIDNLRRLGWNVKRVHNQWAASNKQDFGNTGAEMWFVLQRLIENCCLLLPADDKRFMDQLASRHYKQSEKGKTLLMSKADEKADGNPSPDRVDAFVLSLRGLTLKDFLDAEATKQARTDSVALSQEALVDAMDRARYAPLEGVEQPVDLTQFANSEILGHSPLPRTRLQAKQLRLCNGSLDAALSS